MHRRGFLKVSLAAGIAGAWGVRAETPQAQPNILWVMFDDGRPDILGCYGRPWAKTPNLDAVAARGVRFETAVSQCPICIPSRTSMKTSHYAHETGVMYMGDPPATPTPYVQNQAAKYPNLLRCWTDCGMKPINVGKIHAFAQDWDQRGDPRVRKSDRRDQGKSYPAVNLTTHGWRIGGTIDVHPDDTPTARIADLVMETAERIADAGAPYFLRVSFHAPHVPIEVPPSFMIDPASVTLPLPTKEELESKPRFEREQLRVYAGTLDLSEEQIQIARGTYYGMVALADYEMGRIFERMRARGLLDNTIVAVNSDQGLQMGEHGLHKKRNFYEQTIDAPLLISWPGHVPEGKVIGAPVEMVDFLPTLLDLSGMPVPDGIAGRSLVPLIEGKTDAGRKAVFAEIDHSGSMYDELRQGSGRRVMVRTNEWKLDYFKDPRVADKDGALYDLTNDPGERFNLYRYPARAGIIEELESLVDAWDRTTA